MTLVFRAVKHNPPEREDFQSAWDQGRRPPRLTSPSQIRTYTSVSTFESLALARAKAEALDLGQYIVALELPDSVKRNTKPNGHVDLEGTTPEELLGMVTRVHPLAEGE
jgi:hypothetical protein